MIHPRIFPPALVADVTPNGSIDASRTKLHIFADVGSAPEIGIDVDGVCLVLLTPAESAALRARMLVAENDVRSRSEQPPVFATGTEGRCESCLQPVRPGEQIRIEDEGTEDRVVLHVGPCPERSN